MIAMPGRLAVAVVTGAVVLAGGAGGASGVLNGPARSACNGASTGFALSLASSAKGSSDPLAAARAFVRAAGPEGAGGFGSPASRWRVVPATNDLGGVTLTDGGVFLHTVELTNGRWAVDSGGRCS